MKSTQTKFTAAQVAKWFIDKAASEVKNGGDYLTQLSLQKLLYYAKGFYYVFENEPLFDDKIVAQKFGPVVPSLVDTLKKYGYNQIVNEFSNAEPIKDKSVIEFLNFIYENIAAVYAAKKLVELTHKEKPWCGKKHGEVINEELICNYFRDTYFDNENIDWVVSRESLLSAITRHNMQKYQKAYKVLAQC